MMSAKQAQDRFDLEVLNELRPDMGEWASEPISMTVRELSEALPATETDVKAALERLKAAGRVAGGPSGWRFVK